MDVYVSSDFEVQRTSTTPIGYSPSQIATAYNFNQISFGSIKGDGTGQTIAIVTYGDDPNIAKDLVTFDTTFGLTAPSSFSKVNQTGGSVLPPADKVWATGIAASVEWAHAMAPGASIELVEAVSNWPADLLAANNYVKSQPSVSVVLATWSNYESPTETITDQSFTTPAGHAGVTFVVAAGDFVGLNQGTSYPAMSPNVVAVGGTTLTLNANGTRKNEAAWILSDSGPSFNYYEPKPSYQTGLASTKGMSSRTDSDVSFNADPSTGYSVYDSYGSQGWAVVGGTGTAATLMASLIAIADQGRTLSGVGTLDSRSQSLPLIYTTLSTDNFDVTTGHNFFNAVTGYDLASGWGVPVANKFVADLAHFATVSLNSSQSPLIYGQSVTITATVASIAPGILSPTGTVVFRSGSTVLATVPLVGGKASFSTSSLAVGDTPITGYYLGDANFVAQKSATLDEIVAVPTTTTISASATGATVGQQLTFTVNVAPGSQIAGRPTGVVNLMDGTTVIGTMTLTAGKATFSISTLPVGTHTISAAYLGDTGSLFFPSFSLKLTITIAALRR